MNYSFQSLFNLDGTYRQSASSQYGKNSRWGSFWSVGGSWNLHNESWLKDTKVTQLRLRATIGSTGSQSSGAYNALSSYTYDIMNMYNGLLGATLDGLKNPELKWQTKLEENIGIDFQWDKRYSLRLEIYNSMTNNTVNSLSLPPSVGFGSVMENVGKVQNRGFDLSASATVWQNPAERSYVTLSLQASHNKNKLKEISDAMRAFNERQIANVTGTTTPLAKYYDGVSMDAIWAMRSLGIDPANGREIYWAKDKETGERYRTYTYDASLEEIVGDALPKISGNFGLNVQYKGFGLSAVFRYQLGAKMYNSTLLNKVENADIRSNVDRRIYTDRWRKPGDQTFFKAINEKVYFSELGVMASAKTYPTSRFVQKRNELNFSSIQLSYDFWKCKFLKKCGIERMQVRLNTNDIFTLSTIEIERGTSYPFARSYNASLSITL